MTKYRRRKYREYLENGIDWQLVAIALYCAALSVSLCGLLLALFLGPDFVEVLLGV